MKQAFQELRDDTSNDTDLSSLCEMRTRYFFLAQTEVTASGLSVNVCRFL